MVDKVYGKLDADELAMLMARATNTPQTNAYSLDPLDSMDSEGAAKYLKMVPEEGLEPPLSCPKRILNPSRLPIPPLRHGV